MTNGTHLRFGPTITPRQGPDGPRVVCFTARPADILRIARIERIARDRGGRLTGFQRPAILSHIREIAEYLQRDDAILPNAIILAFGHGARLDVDGNLVVDVSEDAPPGWVVDGQQRLTAASGMKDPGFELVVSAFLCEDPAELNRQFILINNVRPLAKPLVYELLPGVAGLPHRLSDRSGAALLTEALNYREDSSLRELIVQQTNPEGLIRDTLLQRLLMNSMGHGALRELGTEALLDEGYALVSAFFAAVRRVFHDDWQGHTPKTSRLLHGAGIVALGFVMDEIAIRFRARTEADFVAGLAPLVGRTRWTSGTWKFGDQERPWNALQNTNADYRLLSHHLVRMVRGRGDRDAALALQADTDHGSDTLAQHEVDLRPVPAQAAE